MFGSKITSFALLAGYATAVSITPHEQFSSSIGVLGCHVNTDRLAYWPSMPDCHNFCKKISYGGRSMTVAHIDTSGGAHDISYDAYAYLTTGQHAAQSHAYGGGVEMQVEDVDPSQCADIFDGGKVAFMANSPNFLINCPANTWMAQNHVAYNIATLTCTYGLHELCTFDAFWQPHCPSGVQGANIPLVGHPTFNTKIPSGEKYVAP